MKIAISVGICVTFALFVISCGSSAPKPTSGDMEALELTVQPATVNVDNTITFTAKNKGDADVICDYAFEAVGPMSNWNMQYYRGYRYGISVPQGATVAQSVDNWRPAATGVANVTGEAQLNNDPTPSDNSKKIRVEIFENGNTSSHGGFHIRFHIL